jgi:hypothetical protein
MSEVELICGDIVLCDLIWNILMGGGFSAGLKGPGREADHSPPSPRLRMRGAIPPLL